MATSGIWSSMLKEASNVTPLPRGSLLLLSEKSQNQAFIVQQLRNANSRCKTDSFLSPIKSRATNSTQEEPELANAFGLGYTFIEFRDEDEFDDIISHLDIHTLDNPQFPQAIQSVTIEENVVVAIVLDWDDIRKWASQINSWIELIKSALGNRDLEPVINTLRVRLQTYRSPTGGNAAEDIEVELPLEEGQYDAPLGVDLMFVVVGSEIVVDSNSTLSDDAVDFAQQFLRIVGLKHGASTVYVPRPEGNSGLIDIVSERLRIPVYSAAQTNRRAHPMVVEQDKMLIPAGWDSRNKILIDKHPNTQSVIALSEVWGTGDALEIYDKTLDIEPESEDEEDDNFVPKTDFQEFLAKQHEILETRLKEYPAPAAQPAVLPEPNANVDYNVGGIQVEGVDEVLRRLKAREAAVAAPQTPDRSTTRSESNTPQTPGNTSQNEVLASFFQNLLERRKNSPGANSPGA